MFDVFAVGDIKLDVFIDLGKKARVACSMDRAACQIALKYGQKIPVESAVSMMAGSAPNTAIGLRRLGCTSAVMSVIGDDTVAVLTKEVFAKERIPTTYVHVQKNRPSSFSAILNFNGESTILAAHQSFSYKLPRKIPAAWVLVTELGENYAKLFRELAARAKRGEFRLAVNPGAIQLERLDRSLYDLLKASHVLFVNKAEAERLALHESEDMRLLLQKLQSLGPKTVLVTDGARGAYAIEDGVVYRAPAFPAKRVETTGAGDAAASSFLAALMQNKDLKTALAWAMVNSASVVEHIGPQAGLLSKSELLKRVRAHPKFRVVPL